MVYRFLRGKNMPAKKKKTTQLRGAVNNIILESLYSGEKYGYEIIKEVEEKTNGKVKLKQPSLYSSLKRFETKNYIKSYWADSDIGGKRHYYSLTSEGMDYYRKHILKADEVEEIDDIETADQEEYEIDTPEEMTNNFSRYSFNVQDKLDQLLAEDIEEDENKVAPVVTENDEGESEELLDELYENNETVYSEEDLINDQNEISEKEEIIADHEFRTPTPITEEIKRIEEQKKAPDQPAEYKDVDLTHNVYDDITKIEEVVSDNALDDLLYSEENNEQIKEIPQKEKPRIYTDENGITKMYYPDEEKKIVNNKVFDNVGYRTNTETIFDKAKRPTESKNTGIQLDELSDEEREQRTSLFMEKFNNRTRELTANKEPISQEPEPEPEEKPPIDIDYKKVLNGIYDANEQSNDDVLTEEVEYTPVEEDIDDITPAYVPSEDTDYNIKIFTEEKNKKLQSKYLLVNKAKFSFGLTMLLFMLVQITVMLILFKNKGVLMDKQYWVFQTAYILIALVTLYFCIPVFVSPNKQATNTFKLGYMLIFGILAFFIVVILTYAINTFLGMELTNITYYIPTLVVPVVLSLNFVFGPIIYKIISQSKRLY